MSVEKKQCCCSRGRDGSCGKQDKSCGGCSSGGCAGGGCRDKTIYITEDEKAFLTQLAEIPFLPLARFMMQSTQLADAVAVWAAPIYLNSRNETSDDVKNTGAVLQSLEDKYLVTLDYDLPLQNGDYSIYEESRVYRDFCETAYKGVVADGVIYDLPYLQCGSIALTTLGQDALEI